MRGKFPWTCKHFNSPNNDIKSSLGYFHITGTPPMSLNCILKFFWEAWGKFPCGSFPRDSTGKGGGNMHIENSPEFPRGNHEEISSEMIPPNSLINPCGNLGDVDGSPTGKYLRLLGYLDFELEKWELKKKDEYWELMRMYPFSIHSSLIYC